MYYVYILQSMQTGRFYVGLTNNILRRFYQHRDGQSAATRNRGPWWMPYYEMYPSRKDAAHREVGIKRKHSMASIRRIIHSSFPDLKLIGEHAQEMPQ